MGLYLCVYAGDETDDEVGGVEVGTYADFETFRDAVRAPLGADASSYPILLEHPDSGTPWTDDDARELIGELDRLAPVLQALPACIHAPDSWQPRIMKVTGLVPSSLWESYVDVDGEILLVQLRRLAAVAVELGRPIEFL